MVVVQGGCSVVWCEGCCLREMDGSSERFGGVEINFLPELTASLSQIGHGDLQMPCR